MSNAFSNVIRRHIEKQIAKDLIDKSEITHITKFSGNDELYSIFRNYIVKRAIAYNDEIKGSNVYYTIKGNSLYMYASSYSYIKRLMNNVTRTKAFKDKANDEFDLSTYTTNDVLLNMQKAVPLSILKSFSTNKDVYIEYAAKSNTVVTPNKIKGNISLTIKNANFNTAEIASYFKDVMYVSGKNLISDISNTFKALFLGKPTKTYHRAQKTSGKIKKKFNQKTAVAHNPERLRDIKGQFQSIAGLQSLLEDSVYRHIKTNMDSAAYFKTDTNNFSETVELGAITRIGETGIIVPYKYQDKSSGTKHRYDSFERGGRHHQTGREPSTVISLSIRAAAAKLVGKRFKVDPVRSVF